MLLNWMVQREELQREAGQAGLCPALVALLQTLTSPRAVQVGTPAYGVAVLPDHVTPGIT